MWGAGVVGAGPRHAPVIPSPAMLQTLMDMGFSRDRAEQVKIGNQFYQLILYTSMLNALIEKKIIYFF